MGAAISGPMALGERSPSYIPEPEAGRASPATRAAARSFDGVPCGDGCRHRSFAGAGGSVAVSSWEPLTRQ